MKEDYLWDKTGTVDPEIEQLENALQVFRYKETAPPALPAKVVPFRKEQPGRKIFQFALAAAACLTFGAIAIGVWLQVLKNNIENSRNSAAVVKPESEVKPDDTKPPVDKAPSNKPNNEIAKKPEKIKQSSERKFVQVRQVVPAVAREKESRAQIVKAAKQEVQLTKEEQYAYNQLMLALSFTSSKLKMVKDKVEGIEEKPVLENGR